MLMILIFSHYCHHDHQYIYICNEAERVPDTYKQLSSVASTTLYGAIVL